MLTANKTAKWIIYVFSALIIVYLVGYAVLLALAANDSKRYTAIELMTAVMPIIMLLDFWFRFLGQQTPAQLIKPYILLPLPKYACVDSFIGSSLLTSGNLIWFFFLIPYSLMSVVFSYGLLTTLSLLLFFYLIILADSQWYTIVRTLTIHHAVWWLLPTAVTGVWLLPWFTDDFKALLDFYAPVGTAIGHGSLLPHLVAIGLLTVFVSSNRRLQYISVWQELGKQTVSTPKKIVQLSALQRFGDTGEYLKLEIKSLLRNKNPRKTSIVATLAVLAISVVILLTNVYDSRFMMNFWCLYNFAIYALTLLVKVMSYEGNYIDALMVHKENILKLLTAKYYFFCALLFLPFVLMLPMVFIGKWDLLMLISYGVFTAGFQHFFIMQLAVYNKATLPLNAKLISKNGIENSQLQLVLEMSALFVPLTVVQLLEAFLDPQVAWLLMLAVGIGFVGTHRLWLRNIYNRMMRRKYTLLEGLHI